MPSTACYCRESHHLLQPVIAVGVITFYSLLLPWESSPSTACYCCGSHHLLQPVIAMGVIPFYSLLLPCVYKRFVIYAFPGEPDSVALTLSHWAVGDLPGEPDSVTPC